MTEKLYEKDAYINTFTAKVVECSKEDGFFNIVLDKTAFFPEGGGQKSDSGTLDGMEVIDVQIKDSVIYHKIKEPQTVGKTIEGKIDRYVRFFRMQNHTGEHLVSGLLHSEYGYNNVGFHMGSDFVTVDTDGKIGYSELLKIEEKANMAVYENVPVRTFVPTEKELECLDIRSKIELKDGIRAVEIEGYDLCACCAPHVKRTGEIGIVKILNSYPHRGGTRFEMLCGHDALEYFREKMSDNGKIMNLLSSPDGKTPEAVEKTLAALSAAEYEIKTLREKLALAKMQTERVNSVTVGFIPDADFDDLRVGINCLTEKNEGICAVLSENSDGNCIYIVASEKTDISPFMAELKGKLQVKGGGKNNYSQGKIAAGFSDFLSALSE